jgi:hypothetical protein
LRDEIRTSGTRKSRGLGQAQAAEQQQRHNRPVAGSRFLGRAQQRTLLIDIQRLGRCPGELLAAHDRRPPAPTKRNSESIAASA